MIIMKTKFGSHLYGLDTPNSDLDFKSISIPPLRQILLRGPMDYEDRGTSDSTRKNTKDDVDDKVYSLGKFAALAVEGEMQMIDILFAPAEALLVNHLPWQLVRWNRGLFVSKNMSGYLTYIKRQTAKYGFKGSRINAAQRVIEALQPWERTDRLEAAFPAFGRLVDENIRLETRDDGKRYLAVNEKLYPFTERIGRVHDSLSKFIEQYGARAKLAASNEGVDWKAVSHAVRASYQIEMLATRGAIEFPFKGAQKETLLKIKTGQVTWAEASDILEQASGCAIEAMAKAPLPEEVNREEIDDLLMACYNAAFRSEISISISNFA